MKLYISLDKCTHLIDLSVWYCFVCSNNLHFKHCASGLIFIKYIWNFKLNCGSCVSKKYIFVVPGIDWKWYIIPNLKGTWIIYLNFKVSTGSTVCSTEWFCYNCNRIISYFELTEAEFRSRKWSCWNCNLSLLYIDNSIAKHIYVLWFCFYVFVWHFRIFDVLAAKITFFIIVFVTFI